MIDPGRGYFSTCAKLVVTENITLDGVIDLAAGWFDPLAEDVDQSDINSATTEHRQAADALLVGRNTFEAFREFWPKQTDDPTGISDYLHTVNKYVVSSTLDDPGWENTTVLGCSRRGRSFPAPSYCATQPARHELVSVGPREPQVPLGCPSVQQFPLKAERGRSGAPIVGSFTHDR